MWKQIDISFKPSLDIRMDWGKRKDISRDIDTANRDINTLKPLVLMAIPKKHALLRAKLEFMLIERI
jgi:hypothetical protein